MNATRKERPYPMSEKDLARFTEKYEVTESGCWEWRGSLNYKGYAYFYHGKSVSAHRVAYQQYVGEIAEGLTIDHLCRVRHCVNPDHLEVVTHAENVRRAVRKTILKGDITHCPQGHEYTPENIDMAGGHPQCRTCRAEGKSRAGRRQVTCPDCGLSLRKNNLWGHSVRFHRADDERKEITDD